MRAQLSPTEKADLRRLEITVEKGLTTFREVGCALLEIKARQLYRASHETWEEYCRDRWQISRVHAHRMIEAAQVDATLPTGNKPANERQARELARVPAEQRSEVMDQAAAGGAKPTAARIQQLAAKALEGLTPQQQRGLIEDEERKLRTPKADGNEADRLRAERIQQHCRTLRKLHAGLVHVADEADEALDRYQQVISKAL